ncbi:hypothetical protein ISP11_23275 [Lelliottia nimipressuralis]|uniref:Uncharacterized protein n=1 Tax=Lelliottia nimipressuralis TaxID=69220 RepID=A0ABD4KGK4_9ENTR|nr:hypothetical protein [Lelliottia nimipressuralis]
MLAARGKNGAGPGKYPQKGCEAAGSSSQVGCSPKFFLLSFKSSVANGWIGEQVFLNVEQPHLISSPLPDYVKRLSFFKTFFQLI